MKNDNTNIIEFEQKAAERGITLPTEGSNENMDKKFMKLKIDLENMKMAISTSLLSVVVLVTLVNNSGGLSNMVTPSDSGGRGIASVSGGPTAWEDHVSKQISSRGLSQGAKRGRSPSSVDELTFGFFEGKYSVRLVDGKISALEFIHSSDNSDHPKHLESPLVFLAEHRSLLAVPFNSAVAVENIKSATGELHVFDLQAARDSKIVGRAEFNMDVSGRLLSFKVVPMQVATN